MKKFFIYFFTFISITSVCFAQSTNKKPFIKEIVPQTGQEEEIIVIRGENFGKQRYLFDSQNYINFNGFLGTEILSWSDSQIQIRAPKKEVFTDGYRKTIKQIGSLPFFGGAVNFVTKILPIRTAYAPVVGGLKNDISVVTLSGESNPYIFYYTEEKNGEKVGEWKELLNIAMEVGGNIIKIPLDTVKKIVHPRETIKEVINDINIQNRKNRRILMQTPIMQSDLISEPIKQQESETDNWKVIKNNEIGFSVKIPSEYDWQEKNSNGGWDCSISHKR